MGIKYLIMYLEIIFLKNISSLFINIMYIYNDENLVKLVYVYV